MITFSTDDHTTFETGTSTLIVQADGDHAVIQSLAEAVSAPDGTFRRLAQVVVENGFDVPPFICIRRDESELHLFLVGKVTARIAGPEGTVLDGTSTSTWTEHAVPIDASVTIQWTEEPAVIDDRPHVPQPTTSSPPDALEPAETAIPQPPPDIPPTAEDDVAPGPVVGGSEVFPEAPSVPDSAVDSRDSASSTAPHSFEPPTPAAMPDPNLLGTEPVGTDPVEPPTPQVDVWSPGATVMTSGDSPAPSGDLDGDATLDAEEVRRSLTEESPTHPSPNSPLVTARVCPCGAPNPLGTEACIVCGSSLRREGVTIGQVPRPSIGSLVLDDGTRLPLDDSFVLGRNVPVTYEIAGRPCPGISIESPTKQVSKVHLEVRLVDWTVNVVDLDSANGTYIEDSEGRSPKRLRPNVVEQVSPGDNVHFGDRSFVFEAIAGL